jgi:hypothetical protein
MVATTEDMTHGHLVDMMSQVRQGTLDAAGAPWGILCRQAHDPLLDLLCDMGPAQLSSLCAAVKLLGDQSRIPAQERVWSRGGRNGFEPGATEWMSQRGAATSFRVSQAEPAPTELGFEDAVFLLEVGDDLWLVTLQPAGHHGNKHVADHRVSSGWKL